MIFFVLRRSLKKMIPNIVIKKYPVPSNIGPYDNGIPLKAYIVMKVAITNREYAPITYGLRYSRIIPLCSLEADFLRSTCETVLINTPNMRSKE